MIPEPATISLFCPPMPVYKVNGHRRITAEESMVATITFPGGVVCMLEAVIPPTCVRWQSLLFWMVDACIGHGEQHGMELTVQLPPEPVVFRWYTMVALAIDAPSTLLMPDGSRWEGSVRFPDCRTNIFTMVAEAVTAVGTLEKVG